MERLGLGPDVLLGDNPKLVYGRMTGWGQDGPLAHAAGHDINYIALSGVLSTVGREGRPSPPVNYVGDFGGGGMMLAFAMVSALLAVRNGAAGQVIDCAMTDGSALLASLTWGLYARGPVEGRDRRQLRSTAAAPITTPMRPPTANGSRSARSSRNSAPSSRARLGHRRAARASRGPKATAGGAVPDPQTRDEWCDLLEGTRRLLRAGPARSPRRRTIRTIAARGTFVEVDGVIQPAPAPRYSKTATEAPRPARSDAEALLAELGYDPARIGALRRRRGDRLDRKAGIAFDDPLREPRPLAGAPERRAVDDAVAQGPAVGASAAARSGGGCRRTRCCISPADSRTVA